MKNQRHTQSTTEPLAISNTPAEPPPPPGELPCAAKEALEFNASVISEFFGIDDRDSDPKFNAPRAALSRSIRNLEERGLIERTGYSIKLTDAGRMLTDFQNQNTCKSGMECRIPST
jgi:hypothetical protein